MLRIPLEDTFADVLSKAQRGAGLSDDSLCQVSNVSPTDLKRLKEGELLEAPLRQLAAPLNLGEQALLQLAHRKYLPEPRELEGLAQFNTRFGDMTVNSYLVWDPRSRDAVAFDTGAVAFGVMAAVRTKQLNLRLVLLTHTHGDHVADLDRFRSESAAEIWASEKEPFPGTRSFSVGHEFSAGGLRVQTRSTTGHSIGGTTYVISGLQAPVAVVGDALFAASMGGGKISFKEALETNRKAIFTLPNSCVLCPGHGPITTVGEEKLNNPFYPEFQNHA
ncbi:MAG: MBL fold metallo-hydrolase [Verrucomicrobia bacterium]|nr:MBL fold metallo-hydrolase [Verrucomicrobiota bacterium]